MLFDNFENFFRYAKKSENSLMAYDFIVNYLHKPLPCGKYEIVGDEVFAIVSEFDTVPAESKDFEMHKKYIDLQFLVSGREALYLERPEALEESVPYSEKEDITFLKGSVGNCSLIMQPNQFVVFYPHEAHKAGCSINGETQHVKKIVIKVAMHK